MSKLTNILCTYTGGGIHIYHALYESKVWISTDFNLYGTYDTNPLVIEEDLDCDYDSHWVNVDYPLPTWGDIIDSIRENMGSEDCRNLCLDEIIEDIERNGMSMDDPLNKDDLKTKNDEMMKKIQDRLIDPWTDDCEDYEDSTPIDLEYAEGLLKDLVEEDKLIGDDDYCIPEGTTPEMLMVAYNDLLKTRKGELVVSRLVDYLIEANDVELYSGYHTCYGKGNPDVVPVDFIDDGYFDDVLPASSADCVAVGLRSANTLNGFFCWYDVKKEQFFSSDNPFEDGIIDTEAFAKFILSDDGEECRNELVFNMSREDYENIFGKEDEEEEDE